ncbi:hypothetical protein CJ030_MR6G029203 [Morella rubra]|uniref:Uncharacterized protein n=1 Tax=Morella rubra TaxID=262757 RepID=A0A6A1VEZ2_9ROSI|nr:hypothetical protein CJ030_MR6G029203 [Morella rubra]
MFQHYSVFNSKEEALEHPYPEMNKEEWTHVCDLFESEEFQEKIEALQLQHESEGKPYTEVEIFAEVLRTKAGYVRGLGVQYGLLDHHLQYRPLICPRDWRRSD